VNVRTLLERFAHRWPRKLAAVALAGLMWLFVTTTETGTAQRSLLVPITTLGATPDQAVVGLPPFAEVTVSGPTNRVDRLRPESIEAVIDLSGLTGNFQAPVVVTPPQGVTLERVNPNEVLGILERVTTKQVPVQVVYLGPPPADVRLRSVAEPDVVGVRGRAPRLERVAQVIVAVDPADGGDLVAPFAADAAGRPVDEVSVEPSSIAVTTVAESVLVRREVGLELDVVERPRLREVMLDQERAVVVGPPTVVAGLNTLAARVDLPTEGLPGGRYTLPVTITTPAGVVPVGEVTATVEFAPATETDRAPQ
jgi:YbbR domain-containing protein